MAGDQRIIETISKQGIRSSPRNHWRMEHPKPGDHVRWADGTLGRIDQVGPSMMCDVSQVIACEEQGSAYLTEDGHVSISGGPFKMLKQDELEPEYVCADGHFWNWGDNFPGAGHGCEFKIARPVFRHVPKEEGSA